MTVKDSKITHVIVSTGKSQIPMPHRENRLAKYLLEKDDTKKVIWVYPELHETNSSEFKQQQNKLYEFKLQTTLSYNLVDIPGFRQYYRSEFKNLYEEIPDDNKVLWFTKPIFTNLINQDWLQINYDCSDHETSIGWLTKGELGYRKFYKKTIVSKLRKYSEEKILTYSDNVFVSSEYLYDRFKTDRNQQHINLVETGIDYSNFKNKKDKFDKLKDISPPRIGFVGKMKKKIDYDLLGSVADYNPDWNIILVGPLEGINSQKISFLQNKKNVYWIDSVPHEDIPSVMNSLELGLMPYKNIEYNKAVVPLKFFEYLSCDLPVVGCNLPSTKKYEHDKVYIHTLDNPRDFTEACQKALLWPRNSKKRTEIAKQSNWDDKFDYIYNTVMKNVEIK